MWPSLLCAPHHLICTEEPELPDARSPSGPTCVSLWPVIRSEPGIKGLSERSGRHVPWEPALTARKLRAHHLCRGEEPHMHTHSTPALLHPLPPHLGTVVAAGSGVRQRGQGDWRRGKREQKLSSTQTSKPGFHRDVAVGSSTMHISILSPQCSHVPLGVHCFLLPLPSDTSAPAASRIFFSGP